MENHSESSRGDSSVDSLVPDLIFYCPKDKNHKCQGKERFLRHLTNCKLLKPYPEFYSCKFETLHLFVSQEEKIRHEIDCPSQLKYRREGSILAESSLVSNYKFQNQGYDPSYQSKFPNTSYYSMNKEKLDREEQEIRNEKARVRINLTSLVSVAQRLDAMESSMSEKIPFFGSLGTGFVKFTIQVFNKQDIEQFNPDFHHTSIFKLVKLDSPEFETWVRRPDLPADRIVGELFIGQVSRSFLQNVVDFKLEITEKTQTYFVKDRKENIFCFVALSVLAERDAILKRYKELIHQSIIVIHYKKSDFYNIMLEQDTLEKNLSNQISIKTTQLREGHALLSPIHEEIAQVKASIVSAERAIAELSAFLSKPSPRTLDLHEQNLHLANLSVDIQALEHQIEQQKHTLNISLSTATQQKAAEYLEILSQDISQIERKIRRKSDNTRILRDDIERSELRSSELQQESDRMKQELFELQVEETKLKSAIKAEEDRTGTNRTGLPASTTQNQSWDRNKMQKPVKPIGIVACPAALCRLCKTNPAEIVNKPCQHAALCANCFKAAVATTLRGCLLCGTRIEFAFRIKLC